MTALLATFGAVFFAYGLYLGALCSRGTPQPDVFVDGGMSLPGWVAIFGSAGAIVAALGLHDHLLLVSRYGLQASHLALGLVLAALVGALVRKRVWLAARILGVRTVGDAAGAYFGSVSIRIIFLGVLFLFSVPLAAYWLGEIGDLVAAVTAGAVARETAIWIVAFFLFLSSALGGWRASAYLIGAQAMLMFALMCAGLALSAAASGGLLFAVPVAEGVLADRIPGVIQFSAGIGKDATSGGLWTTVAIVSFAIGLIGIVLSPAFSFLGITSSTRRGAAFEQVWMTAGLAVGLLLLLAPAIGAALGPDGYAGLAERLAGRSPLFGIAFILLILVSLQIGVTFFVAAGAHIASIELVHRYILPELDGRGLKLAARIVLAFTWLAVAVAASATPLAAAILATLALPLAAQLLPAYLGLCWLPWISRSAVLTGFIIGGLIVLFTEPFGLIAFEKLFVDLPWGRWPLTIHSAAWGLAFNLATCLLAALFTRSGPEREGRQRLHDEFHERHRQSFGGRAARGARWSLVLIWSFLALGPGAILGNTLFTQTDAGAAGGVSGLPSLLVWQLAFWLAGVFLVWWMAYQTGLSLFDGTAPRRLRPVVPEGLPLGQARPAWITRILARIAFRS